MEQSKIEFKTHYGNTAPFEIKRGTAQGCPLSPLIYIISMDLMHAGIRRNPIHEHAEDGYKLEGITRILRINATRTIRSYLHDHKKDLNE